MIFFKLSDIEKAFAEQKITQRQFITNIKHDPDISSECMHMYPWALTIDEAVYCCLHNVTEKPVCPHCGKSLQWSGRINKGYNETCGDAVCLKAVWSEKRRGCNNISKLRKERFLEKVKRVRVLNDRTIKRLIEYDYEIELIDRQDILDYLDNRYKDSSSRLETVQRIRLGIEEKPECPVCGNPVRWVGKKSKLYTEYCSIACRAHSDKTKEKMKQTQSERAELYKEKIREQYGVDFLCQTDDFKEKRKQTLMKRYGTTKLYQVKEIRDKIVDSNLKRFGYDCAFKSPDKEDV